MSLLSTLLIASMALLASGCLWGVVMDSDTGAPIAGASVSYADSYGHTGTATTNSKGLYWFDSATGPIPALGPVNLTVGASGYSPLSLPTLVHYDDNANASLANLSSFWDVQSFVLMLSGAPATTADLAVTDLFADNQPQGVMWVRITNNGPATLANNKVSVTVSQSRSTLTVPPMVDSATATTEYTLNLAPGQTQTINLGVQIDTSQYRYDFTATAAAVDFTDAASGNNTYKESVEPMIASLALTNACGADISSIQFRRAGDPSWTNMLAFGEVVQKGQARTWLIPPGTYDLRAYIRDQVLNERLNVGISGTYDWTVLAALDIHNSPPNWWPIEEVYIFPEGALVEGPNWLNPGETIPPGAVRRFNLAPGIYMFLVTGPGGGFPRGHHDSAVAGVCAWSPGPSVLDPGVFFCVQ